MLVLRVQSKFILFILLECVRVIDFCKGFVTVLSLTYFPFSEIYFRRQNASHNVMSCIKLILFIDNSNAKPYFCEFEMMKMRLVSL